VKSVVDELKIKLNPIFGR